MAEPRYGRQTPTQSVVLPYSKTRGPEAIGIYNKTNRKAFPWQELLIYDILAENEEGLWVHTKFGYAVPRRNGKNEVAIIIELYALKHGLKVLHTAHRTTTSHSAWERLMDAVKRSRMTIKSKYRAKGSEHIEVAKGGRVEFRTRSTSGGLGEGFDILIIDEAQEYQDAEQSALKYTVSDSDNPLTIFCGTPPTPHSAGTVFSSMREDVLKGNTLNTGWEEWSVDKITDPWDREAWYETNPSMGYILNERKIADEIGRDELDFNIQRLGYWIRYNLKSAISKIEWDDLLAEDKVDLKGRLFAGIKYGLGGYVSMCIGVKTKDDRIWLEAIDCREIRASNRWIMAFLRSAPVGTVIIDGDNGRDQLIRDMRDAGMKKAIVATTREIVAANSSFEQAIFDKKICHPDQPSLTQAVSNCEHRSIGSHGGFGYKALKEGIEPSLIEAAALAYYAASTGKEKKKQKISY